MSDRIDELSDRARWFLSNFDEIDLADICASQEARANQVEEAVQYANEQKQRADRAEAALARVRALRDDLREITGARWIADALDNILGPPANPATREQP